MNFADGSTKDFFEFLGEFPAYGDVAVGSNELTKFLEQAQDPEGGFVEYDGAFFLGDEGKAGFAAFFLGEESFEDESIAGESTGGKSGDQGAGSRYPYDREAGSVGCACRQEARIGNSWGAGITNKSNILTRMQASDELDHSRMFVVRMKG